ncbi:MAG: GNAT family N-acetyltransferase [candidate division Zixibacteria bacterium]|nr:GNAT family N-acetyltransferase [candidate division Zixibacteria bacterium]
METVFETPRLIIRKSTSADVDFFYALWTNPRVMVNVGFPQGLRVTREEVFNQLENQSSTEYDSRLVAEKKDTGEKIGECKLGTPDDEGFSETDVKLFPEFWARGYGTEIKRGLVNYLFRNTDCRGVVATPNKSNIASQKMQEAVGGVRVDEGVFEFPEKMREYTVDVAYLKYVVYREKWDGTPS